MTDEERIAAQELVKQLVLSDRKQEEFGATSVYSIECDHPAIIHESLQHFQRVAQDQDFYTATYRLPFGGTELYVLMLIPDGNDGWFEVFSIGGELIGAGQFVGTKVGWGSVEEVRACASATSTPENVLHILRRNIAWEPQADGNYRSTCGRFHINRSGNGWKVVEFPGYCETLEEAQELAQSLEAYRED